MLSILTSSYNRYRKKYQSTPDMFFVNEKYISQIYQYRSSTPRSPVQYLMDKDITTLFGCLVVIIYDNSSFNYSFYEYDDLYLLVDYALQRPDIPLFYINHPKKMYPFISQSVIKRFNQLSIDKSFIDSLSINCNIELR